MSETKYTCLAVNYLEELTDKNGVSWDKTKENLLVKLRTRILSRQDIHKISSVIGFDVWKGMVWCDFEIWEKGKHTTSIGLKYRLLGFDELLNEEVRQQILDHFNHSDFYTKDDIEVKAEVLGLSVFEFCRWQAFTEVNRHYITESLSFRFYWKQIEI